jgi:hypothetical protein
MNGIQSEMAFPVSFSFNTTDLIQPPVLMMNLDEFALVLSCPLPRCEKESASKDPSCILSGKEAEVQRVKVAKEKITRAAVKQIVCLSFRSIQANGSKLLPFPLYSSSLE